MDEASKIEFDQECPTIDQMRPSLYAFRRDIIPANPNTRMEIIITTTFVNLPSGESTVKGDRCVGGNPDKRVILQTSAKYLS